MISTMRKTKTTEVESIDPWKKYLAEAEEKMETMRVGREPKGMSFGQGCCDPVFDQFQEPREEPTWQNEYELRLLLGDPLFK